MPVNLKALPEGEEAPEVKRTITVFTIGETEYKVPPEANAGRLLQFLWSSKFSELNAITDLLLDMLGPEGFDALKDYPGLDIKDLRAVADDCVQILLGNHLEQQPKPASAAKKAPPKGKRQTG